MGSRGIGQFVKDFGGGVWANSNASCPFAQNLHEQWMSQAGGSSAPITALSRGAVRSVDRPIDAVAIRCYE